jgi:hypothetical protein
MPDVERVDIGFSGGQVLSLRVAQKPYDELLTTLSGDDERWHTLKAEDSEILLDLPQIVYVRRETEEHKVGF